MNKEDKARAYDEALNWMRTIYPSLSGADKEDAEHFFPQLAESEDERIRKMLIEQMVRWKKCAEDNNVEQDVKDASDAIAYLEKQKEPENVSASTMAPSCWTKVPEQCLKCNEYELGYKAGYTHGCTAGYNKAMEEVDEQKEQKTPMSNDLDEEIERFFDECIEVHDAKIYGVNKQVITVDCYELTARHFAQWQKGQKPEDFPTTDEEVNEFLETHSKVEVPEKYKTPDFVFSKQEYESYPIISKDTTSVKPAEWSEEDEKFFRLLHAGLYAMKGRIGVDEYNKAVNRLKSLRPQPHWKPTEEQMKALNAINCYGELSYVGQQSQLIYLYNNLKKLM